MRYEDMEYENCENVLRYIIFDSGNPTRAEIAKRLGLSKATVTQIINRFIAYGLVHEGQRLARHAGTVIAGGNDCDGFHIRYTSEKHFGIVSAARLRAEITAESEPWPPPARGRYSPLLR